MNFNFKKKFSSLIAQRFFMESCFEELKVTKPGNLSKNSSIFGMNIKFFYRAAELSAPIICKKNELGEKIFSASQSCLIELKSNYNLGILLLCTPILEVAINGFEDISDFKKKLNKLLWNISNDEGKKIFNAIKISKPGGIKNYNGKFDIKNISSNSNFKEGMLMASEWDRIARSYVDSYNEIFNKGLPFLKRVKKKFNYEYSIQCLFMYYMALDVDSHLLRKWGSKKAKSVQIKAINITKQIFTKQSSKTLKIISDFDRYLKKKKFNPGTCADLTVTTLLIDKITDIVRPSNLNKSFN